jgi:hypothetical protein
LGRCKDLALTTAVAALIEKGAIQGTGSSNQPLGLLNLPDALSQTSPLQRLLVMSWHQCWRSSEMPKLI